MSSAVLLRERSLKLSAFQVKNPIRTRRYVGEIIFTEFFIELKELLNPDAIPKA